MLETPAIKDERRKRGHVNEIGVMSKVLINNNNVMQMLLPTYLQARRNRNIVNINKAASSSHRSMLYFETICFRAEKELLLEGEGDLFERMSQQILYCWAKLGI